ncbi:hypothetical protein B0H19DRAFT_1253422 [Mycena capillaripes]|nr:hypothetical protein B0H19DRAFT_1253422 [Mycena capillaripes]
MIILVSVLIQTARSVSLRPDNLTLSGSVLDTLAAPVPALAPESFAPPRPSTLPSMVERDYLANGGALPCEAFTGDPEVQRKLADALAIFGEKEAETRELVKAFIAGE